MICLKLPYQLLIITTLGILLLTSPSDSYAQADSLSVVRAKWETKKVAPGIRLKQYWFKDSVLFHSNQYISFLEVKRKRKHPIDLVYEDTLLKKVSDFGKEHKAIAAINAGFFDVKKGGSVDFLRSNGVIIDTNAVSKNGERPPHRKGAIVINEGKVAIAKWDGSKDWEKQLDGEDVLVTGPVMLLDKQLQQLDPVSHNTYCHPRSAIALGKKNKVLFVVVDGRDKNAAGMSLMELGRVLKWMGCSDAISMDGGGSSALWVNGFPDNGIVSYPSDNKIWDHAGERKVANALVIKRRRK
ncbi:phosphodiester glycosidase family protein [Desertivirga brevis]|uniref:phosphodiester glycosidase family protein n=1 Tax=Desertivirga brevis TaxID=2810310 RepID=UPI001A9597A5|nr:phosphodiester glycosidase family protein [Pedobacter sp. SYSU D00873]